MSVIEEVITGLENLKLNNPSAVVDLLCQIHEKRGDGISSALNMATTLASRLQNQAQSSVAEYLSPKAVASSNVVNDPFPDFSDDQDNKTPKGAAPTTPTSQSTAVKRESLMVALEETMLSYQELLAKHNRDFDEIHARKKAGVAEEDQTIARLQSAQLALLKYPIAGQAIYAALIREGRGFAKTDTGKALKTQLESSPAVAKARTLFEGLNGGMLAEQNSELPSSFLDGLIDALDRDLETVLGELGEVNDVL